MGKSSATTEAKKPAADAATAAAAAASIDTPPAPSNPPPRSRAEARAAPPPRRKPSPITVSRWSEAAFRQARHAITPEAGTEPQDLMDPAYYANIAGKLLAGDIIEVRPADGRYYAELYVWSKGDNWAQVSPLIGVDRPAPTVITAADSIDPDFNIEFVEGGPKHRVIRKSDGAEVSRGFDSPAAANAWLTHNRDKLAAA